MSDKLLEVFKAEAHELLTDMERALLSLESDPFDKEGVSSIFRTMHTLKGSAGMFGFDGMSHITHHLENIYQDIRDDKQTMSGQVLTVTFKTLDHLRELMHDPQMRSADIQLNHGALLKEIQALLSISPSPGSNYNLTDETLLTDEKVCTYYIYVLPHKSILRNGNNTLYLIDDLLGLGEGIALPFFNQIPSIQVVDEKESHLGFEVVLATSKSVSEINDVFLFVESDCELQVTKIADASLIKNHGPEFLWQYHDPATPIGLKKIQSFFFESTSLKKEVGAQKEVQKTEASIRVGADRVDELMNLVSELVTTQARLSLYCYDSNTSNQSVELANISENIEKITRRLRDNAFNMSLVPLESLAVRFQRLVRDLSKELNKTIQFKTEGTDTALDKSIIEKLADPLLHLLRNSIDHGIESSEVRLKNKKPSAGTLTLKAYYSGANVVVEISDDGAGIDLGKVRRKAITNGLISPDTHYDEKDLLDLIFLPGFSTAEQVTGISGRGVGMDVVKRSINGMRGEIDVKTQSQKGTTFAITLPLTLSILDGLLVKIGNTNFILPLGSVAKCYEVETDTLESTFNQWITLEGTRTPFFFLRRDFQITEDKPKHSQVINVQSNGSLIGLAVDKVEGEYQAVLRPLGLFYRDQEEFSGATILGNGSVALVVDPNKLIRKLTLLSKN